MLTHSNHVYQKPRGGGMSDSRRHGRSSSAFSQSINGETRMTLGEPEVQGFVAKLYPIRYSGTGFLYHARVVTDMLQGVKFRDGRFSDKILDVGCGTGFVSQLYPNFDIVGIDTSIEMLRRNPYTTVRAAAEALPFPDNHFDWVICRSLLHHLERPAVGLQEMVRVLKPKGQWVGWEPNLSVFNDWIRKLSKLTKRFSHWHKNFKPHELLSIIESAGLTIVQKRYHGHLAYPLLGFPDIVNTRLPLWVGRKLMWMDEQLSRTPLAITGWATMITAVK